MTFNRVFDLSGFLPSLPLPSPSRARRPAELDVEKVQAAASKVSTSTADAGVAEWSTADLSAVENSDGSMLASIGRQRSASAPPHRTTARVLDEYAQYGELISSEHTPRSEQLNTGVEDPFSDAWSDTSEEPDHTDYPVSPADTVIDHPLSPDSESDELDLLNTALHSLRGVNRLADEWPLSRRAGFSEPQPAQLAHAVAVGRANEMAAQREREQLKEKQDLPPRPVVKAEKQIKPKPREDPPQTQLSKIARSLSTARRILSSPASSLSRVDAPSEFDRFEAARQAKIRRIFRPEADTGVMLRRRIFWAGVSSQVFGGSSGSLPSSAKGGKRQSGKGTGGKSGTPKQGGSGVETGSFVPVKPASASTVPSQKSVAPPQASSDQGPSNASGLSVPKTLLAEESPYKATGDTLSIGGFVPTPFGHLGTAGRVPEQ